MRRLAACGLLLALAGCPAFWAAAPRIAQAAGWVSSLLDVAAGAADAYDARHPSRERDEALDLALARARRAVAALHEAAMAGDEPTMAAARDAALAAYERLWMLLDGYGVLSATPPPGGAEAEAPEPEPVDLPAPDAVRAAMGGSP